MKHFIFILSFFSFFSAVAQEKRDWNVGLSYGAGGVNVFLLPALELDYKKSTISFAPSRNTFALAYTKNLVYLGKKQNIEWIGSFAFIADFMEKPFLGSTWTPDYYTRSVSNEGRYVYFIQSGLRSNVLKRCYLSSQLGLAVLKYTNLQEREFLFAYQLSLGVRLFKHRE